MAGMTEIAGIVAITMATIQGLFKLVEHYVSDKDSGKIDKVHESLIRLEEKFEQKDVCLTDKQASQLNELHALHSRVDSNGTPLWYVPRSWADTQRELADKLQKITEVQFKTLMLLENIAKHLERASRSD